jgi:hypothetical protein
MSAKPAKKSGRKTPDPASPPPGAGSTPATVAEVTRPDSAGSWLDSADPRRRTLGRVFLAGIWLYVAALWLLALDQWFRWGIFGPAVPPVS